MSAPEQLTGVEKQKRIDQLRMINEIARKRHPEFSAEFDAMLLEAEDVPTEEIQ